MEADRFDHVAKALAAGVPRRVVLRRLVAGALGGWLGLPRLGAGAAPPCRGVGHPCAGSQVCCLGLVCAPTGTCQDAQGLLSSLGLPGVAPTPTATPTTVPTPAPPAPPPATQPPTTAAPAPGPATTPALAPDATLRVVAATCPPGLGAVDPADFAQSCGRPDQRANGLALRLTGPVAATRVTGDGGQPGETVFADLPPGPVTLQIPPPAGPATLYAFCGVDPAAPAVQQLSTGRQTGTGRPAGLQLALALAPGTTLTCTVFTVPDALSATTGALLIQAATCAPGITPSPTGVPGASCAHPAGGARFALTRVPAAPATPGAAPSPVAPPALTGMTDADGVLRFGHLAPGRYWLAPRGTPWCRALSDGVDGTGRLVVRAGQRVDVWTYTCVAGAPAATPAGPPRPPAPPPTATAVPSPPAPPTRAATHPLTLAFTASDWQGAYFQASGNLQPWAALYAQSTGYGQGALTFTLPAAPASTTCVLTLTGMTSENWTALPIAIALNGAEVYAGNSPFPTWNGIDGQQPWTTIRFAVPTAPLRAGANTLTVVDRVTQGAFGRPLYLLLADATLTVDLPGAG